LRRASLKFEQWPEDGQAMWRHIGRDGSLLSDAGPGARWAAETRRMIVRDYGFWLSFVFAMYPQSLSERPVTRVSPDRVRAYCRSMEHLAAHSQSNRLSRLSCFMRGAHPDLDWRWLVHCCRALEKAARRKQSAQRKRSRVIHSSKLCEAGLAHLKRAHNDQARSLHARAKDFRDGLIIALLAARPLRIKNFASLRLDGHLKRISTGYLIDIPDIETKTGQPIETFKPDELVPWLTHYVESYRPVLLQGGRSDHLWIHHLGRPYRQSSLAQKVPVLTKRLIGVAISPHLFRDCAATTIATDDPEHVLSIAPLLGHATLRTAEKHYNHARSLEANRRFQDSVRQARRQCLPLRRRDTR
jgi:integrase/recombinase XerD